MQRLSDCVVVADCTMLVAESYVWHRPVPPVPLELPYQAAAEPTGQDSADQSSFDCHSSQKYSTQQSAKHIKRKRRPHTASKQALSPRRAEAQARHDAVLPVLQSAYVLFQNWLSEQRVPRLPDALHSPEAEPACSARSAPAVVEQAVPKARDSTALRSREKDCVAEEQPVLRLIDLLGSPGGEPACPLRSVPAAANQALPEAAENSALGSPEQHCGAESLSERTAAEPNSNGFAAQGSPEQPCDAEHGREHTAVDCGTLHEEGSLDLLALAELKAVLKPKFMFLPTSASIGQGRPCGGIKGPPLAGEVDVLVAGAAPTAARDAHRPGKARDADGSQQGACSPAAVLMEHAAVAGAASVRDSGQEAGGAGGSQVGARDPLRAITSTRGSDWTTKGGEGSLSSECNLFDVVVEHEGAEECEALAFQTRVVVPPRCRFLLSDVTRLRPLLPRALPLTLRVGWRLRSAGLHSRARTCSGKVGVLDALAGLSLVLSRRWRLQTYDVLCFAHAPGAAPLLDCHAEGFGLKRSSGSESLLRVPLKGEYGGAERCFFSCSKSWLTVARGISCVRRQSRRRFPLHRRCAVAFASLSTLTPTTT